MQKILLTALLLTSFSSYADVCPFPADTTLPNEGVQAWAGGGIDTERGDRIKVVSCLNGTEISSPQTKGELNISVIEDYQELVSSITRTRKSGFSIGFDKYKIGMTRSSKFTQTIVNKAFAKSFVLKYDLNLDNIRFDVDPNKPLNAFGEKTLKLSGCDFKKVCGNQFVSQTEKGASVFIAIQFNFASNLLKNEFKKGFDFDFKANIKGVDVGTSLGRSVESLNSTLKENGRIDIIATQMGGDVTALGRFLGKEGDMPIFSCSLKDMKACEAAINKAVEYITTEEFLQGAREYPAILNFATRDYWELLPGFTPISELTDAIKTDRELLANELELRSNDKAKLEATLKLNLFDKDKEKINQLLTTLEVDITNLYQAGLFCFSDLENCVEHTTSVFEKLSTYKLPIVQSLDTINYARNGIATASHIYNSDHQTNNAIDGNDESEWNAGLTPTYRKRPRWWKSHQTYYRNVWIEIDLGAIREFTEITALVRQDPNGQTTHKVFLDNIEQHTWSQPTGNRNKLSWIPTEPQQAQKIRIRTTQSPAWVAWYEIEIKGTFLSFVPVADIFKHQALLLHHKIADTDFDQIPDHWEIKHQLDPLVDDANDDIDKDGLSNLEEYQNNTNPQKEDSDDDGMPDTWEIENNLSTLVNDAEDDIDKDGLNNLAEYQSKTNPHEKDTDADGMPDGWEIQYSLNPLRDDGSDDTDKDDLNNLVEYQNKTNPNEKDTDADGMPDGWEISNGTNPLTDDARNDVDIDGLDNLAEYQHKTKPNEKDTDSDGMPDGWEVTHKLNPLVNDANLDPDDDAMSNLNEFITRNNPNVKNLSNAPVLSGTENDDTFTGIASGNKTIKGFGGNDAVQYLNSKKDITRIGISSDFGVVIINFAGLENDYLEDIERIAFENLDYLSLVDIASMSQVMPLFSVSTAGEPAYKLPTFYTGPVEGLQYQLLGNETGDIISGSPFEDFINVGGGNDAVNAGAGNDVIDGGTGSNFITGGAGHDVFFVDGRSGSTTWSTITDWQRGEQLSLWGWDPAVSTASWAENSGANGFKGATLHADLNNDGIVDASVTFSGLKKEDIPRPLEYSDPKLMWIK